MRIAPLEPTTILPMPPPAQHALAAAWALERARSLLAPIGIPEEPPAPDVAGARIAFQDAVEYLRLALAHAGGRPGRVQVEAALEEAEEALVHLGRPAITPPIAEVIERAVRGAELTRVAIDHFARADVWPMLA